MDTVFMDRSGWVAVSLRCRAAVALTLWLALAGCGSAGQDSTVGDQGPDSASTAADGESSAERVELGSSEALVWGTGEYGVVLVHGAAFDAASWEIQAAQFAEAGMAVLAVEDTSAETLVAAVDFLTAERGAQDVALLGASAGSAAVIDAAGAHPDIYDQLVLISPAGGDIQALSDGPKLFIYSKDEGAAGSIEDLIADAPGEQNDVLAVSGTAHAQAIFETSSGAEVTDAIVNRLTD